MEKITQKEAGDMSRQSKLVGWGDRYAKHRKAPWPFITGVVDKAMEGKDFFSKHFRCFVQQYKGEIVSLSFRTTLFLPTSIRREAKSAFLSIRGVHVISADTLYVVVYFRDKSDFYDINRAIIAMRKLINHNDDRIRNENTYGIQEILL